MGLYAMWCALKKCSWSVVCHSINVASFSPPDISSSTSSCTSGFQPRSRGDSVEKRVESLNDVEYLSQDQISKQIGSAVSNS